MNKQCRQILFGVALLLTSCNATDCNSPSPGPYGMSTSGCTSIITTTTSPSSQPAVNDKIKWVEYSEALEEAKRTGKKLLIYFYADWCPYCSKVNDLVWTDHGVQKIIGNDYVATKVNIDKKELLQEKHDIKGIPSIIMYDVKNSREIGRINGFYEDINIYRNAID